MMLEMRRSCTFALLLFAALGSGCEACEEPPDAAASNQDPQNLEICPPLPEGLEPIEGLSAAHSWSRFGGLMITLSSRPLACGDLAAFHGYCSSQEARGITLGLSAEHNMIGLYSAGDIAYVEFEQGESFGSGGGLRGATLELLTIDDACVTGRIAEVSGTQEPIFTGGFQAPRCLP